MTIPAYNAIYVTRAARIVGTMLHNAVYEFDMDGAQILQQFIQSKVAEQIEQGNPKYVAGKSGQELLMEIVERSSGTILSTIQIENYERSDVYWVGWILTYYQWYSGKQFKDILRTISYDELLGLYTTLHEADVNKSFAVLDMHFTNCKSKLKLLREHCCLTQEELANQSGVSLNTIRAYERKAKDINKAQIDIIDRLAHTLKCQMTDLLD